MAVENNDVGEWVAQELHCNFNPHPACHPALPHRAKKLPVMLNTTSSRPWTEGKINVRLFTIPFLCRLSLLLLLGGICVVSGNKSKQARVTKACLALFPTRWWTNEGLARKFIKCFLCVLLGWEDKKVFERSKSLCNDHRAFTAATLDDELN